MSISDSGLPSERVAQPQLLDFIRDRWALLGYKGGLKGIKEAGGPDIGTVRSAAADPGLPQERDTDKRRELAHMLRFQSWEDLVEAWQLGELTRGAVVCVGPDAYRLATEAAGKLSVDEWVTRLIVANAPKK